MTTQDEWRKREKQWHRAFPIASDVTVEASIPILGGQFIVDDVEESSDDRTHTITYTLVRPRL